MNAVSPVREALRSRDVTLWSLAEHLVGEATRLLWHTLSTFPSGTDHTPRHTLTVEAIAGMLFPDPFLQALTADELFLLVLAFHYHDLGMAGTEAENLTEQGREQVRRQHSISVGDRIVADWKTLGFPDEHTAQLLAEVCRGHRPTRDASGTATWDDIDSIRILGPGRHARLRLLSAMIFAADELHLGADRAPRREQDWKEIRNEESLRHWRRHQHITGPSVVQGKLTFDASVPTLQFERDIRRNVFNKAILAVESSKRQFAADGIPAPILPIAIHWTRDKLWRLLLIECAASREPVTLTDLIESAYTKFDGARASFPAISNDCEEYPPAERARAEVKRACDDLVRRDFLREAQETPNQFLLSADAEPARSVLGTAREADAIDRLFGGPHAAKHEFELYRTRFGDRHLQSTLVPLVRNAYGVNLATEPADSALRRLISRSPTAANILQNVPLLPSILVQRDLLSIMALAGACADAMHSPEFVLDSTVRQALRSLVDNVPANLRRLTAFAEEVALVGGFSLSQVSEAMLPSEGWKKEHAPEGEQAVTRITITQKLPTGSDSGSVALPYLLFAGARLNERVEFTTAAKLPLEVQVSPMPIQADQTPAVEPAVASISVGPGTAELPRRIDFRAELAVDAANKVIEFRCYRISDENSNHCPLVIGSAGPAAAGDRPTKMTIALRLPELRVEHFLQFDQVEEMLQESAVEVRVVTADQRIIMGSQQLPSSTSLTFPKPVEPSLLSALHLVDDNLPIPWVLTEQHAEMIVSGGASGYEQVIREVTSDKPEATSLTLQVAAANDAPYREESFGFLPVGMKFGAPEVAEGGLMSQSEINAEWENPKSRFVLGAYYSDDVGKIVRELREWMQDPTVKEFPLRFGADGPSVHYCRTHVAMQFHPLVDRLWYVERPLVIRVRPMTRLEQYNIELEYWRVVGDERRALLVEERMSAIKAGATGGEKTKPAGGGEGGGTPEDQ